MLIFTLNHATYLNEKRLPNDEVVTPNPNSQSSPLQLRARDIWQKGCAPLNPAKA